MAVLGEHACHVRSVAFSPDGTRIVSGGGRTVRVWDAETGQEKAVLKGHAAEIRSVAFSSDGNRILSGSLDTRLREWADDSRHQK